MHTLIILFATTAAVTACGVRGETAYVRVGGTRVDPLQ